MNRRFLLLFSIFITFCCAFFQEAGISFAQEKKLEVQNLRFGLHPDKSRLVIDLNQQTAFKVFSLPPEGDKPSRLVIDLPAFEWKAGTVQKGKNEYIMNVRSGKVENNTMRIVIDSQKPLSIQNAFIVPKSTSKPDRLVIDYQTGAFPASSKNFGTLETQTTTSLDDLIGSLFPSTEPEPATKSTTASILVPARKPPVPQHNLESPAKPQTPLRKKVIVIDAGHGGQDPGAIGAGKLREKDITLAAAKELKKELERTGRYQVHLTRADDRYLKLHQRVSIARKHNADLFISLHADSIDKPNVSGASIYTLSYKASDAQTAKLAARENQADLIAGVDLSHEDKDVANILIDLAMRDTMNQSKFFANTVVSSLQYKGVRILERPHRYAGFAVLKAPDIPSVLFEMGFMSNRKEAQMLNTPDYRRKIALAMAKSIDDYFNKLDKNSLN